MSKYISFIISNLRHFHNISRQAEAYTIYTLLYNVWSPIVFIKKLM